MVDGGASDEDEGGVTLAAGIRPPSKAGFAGLPQEHLSDPADT